MAILRARRRIIAIAALLGLGAAVVVTALLPPQYQADASLMVGYRQAATAPDAGVPAPLYGGYVATQMDLVTSQAVAVKAVRDLHLLDRKQRRTRYDAALAGPGAPLHKMFARLRNIFSARDEHAEPGAREVQEQIWADRLRRQIHTSNGSNSSIINISFTSADPQVSKQVVNAFAKAYLDTSVALSVDPAKENAVWFDDQVQSLGRNLEQAQAELSDYQREQGIVATDERLDTEQAKLMDLSSQLTQVQGEAYDLKSKKQQAARFAASGGSAGLIPDMLSNPMVLHLKQQIAEQQSKLNELSGQVGPNYPAYKQAVAELASLKKRLSHEINTVSSSVSANVAAVEQREKSLQKAVAEQKRKLLDLRAKRDHVQVLKARVENAQHVYDNALQKVSAVRMESHSTQSNVSLVNSAVAPASPSGPNATRNVALGVILGLAVGTGIALWREVRERTVRSADDVQSGLGVPVLAVIGNGSRRRKRGRQARLASGNSMMAVR